MLVTITVMTPVSLRTSSYSTAKTLPDRPGTPRIRSSSTGSSDPPPGSRPAPNCELTAEYALGSRCNRLTDTIWSCLTVHATGKRAAASYPRLTGHADTGVIGAGVKGIAIAAKARGLTDAVPARSGWRSPNGARRQGHVYQWGPVSWVDPAGPDPPGVTRPVS
jgi:hypothetical protein